MCAEQVASCTTRDSFFEILEYGSPLSQNIVSTASDLVHKKLRVVTGQSGLLEKVRYRNELELSMWRTCKDVLSLKMVNTNG